MLTRLLAILLFFVTSLSSFSQSSYLDFKYGTEFDPKGTIADFIGQIGDIIYVNSFKKGLVIGGVNSKTLNPEFETAVEMPQYNGKDVLFKSIHVLDNQLIMFMQYYDKKEDTNYLFAQRLTDRAVPEGNMEILDKISAEKKKNAGAFSIEVMDEEGRILLYRNPPFDKYANEKFTFKVLDKNLEVVWEKDLELPYADRFFGLSSFLIDDKDNLYMICSFNDYAATKESDGRKKAKEELKANSGNYYSYEIVNYDHKTQKLKEFDIKLETGQKLISIDYNLDVNGDINVSGIFGDEASKGTAVGVYFTKIDHETRKAKSLSTKDFEKEFIREYMESTVSAKRAEKALDKGLGIRNLSIRQFINREDGGLVICGEIYYMYESCYTDPKTGRRSCSYHYVYGAIIVMNISPNGSIDWLSSIPKLQHTVNDGGFFSSYAMITTEDAMYFIYNDNVKNYNPKKKPTKMYNMTGTKNAVTTVARVAGDGKVTKNPEFKLKEVKMLLRPKVRVHVGEGKNERLMVLAKAKKKERIVEVKLD